MTLVKSIGGKKVNFDFNKEFLSIFSDKIKSAVGRNNLLDPPFYVYGLVDIGRYALGMESIRGERNLDNILKYKTTFLFGTAKNMLMKNSAYEVFQEIYEKEFNIFDE